MTNDIILLYKSSLQPPNNNKPPDKFDSLPDESLLEYLKSIITKPETIVVVAPCNSDYLACEKKE